MQLEAEGELGEITFRVVFYGLPIWDGVIIEYKIIFEYNLVSTVLDTTEHSCHKAYYNGTKALHSF